MPRLLALDCDRCEARYVLAATRGGALRIEAIGAVPLLAESASGTARQADVGGALAAELSGFTLRRALGLVTLDRAQLELVQLKLPPSADAELAELVRNQTLQESSGVSDEAVIDFVALDDDPAAPRRVSAVAVQPEHVAQAAELCTALGASPQRAVVRPYAAASLLLPGLDAAAQPALVLNLFTEEVDVTLVAGGRVVYWRTVRIPGATESEAGIRRLVVEVHRTLAVATQVELLPEPPATAWLLGSDDELQAWCGSLGEQLGMAVQVADPLALCQAPLDSPPENLGRYAALLGMVAAEARGVAPPLDLLHPKQAPRRAPRWRVPALAAAIVAVALGYVAHSAWRELAEVRQENQQLTTRKQQLDAALKKAAEQQNLVAAVRAWQATDVVWLDELLDLSRRFPAGSDAQLLRLTAGPGRGGGGELFFEGVVRAPEVVTELGQSLRDPFHEFRSDSVQQRGGQPDYDWHFQAAVSVTPRSGEQYRTGPGAAR